MALRVLVVDDNADFRRSARELLLAAGFDVIADAGNGGEAIELARVHRPDVVLLDVQLPGMNGFVVADRLAEFRLPPAVVLVSARPRLAYGARIAAAPVLGFLAKDELTGGALWQLLG